MMTRSNTGPEMFKRFLNALEAYMPPGYSPFLLKLKRGAKDPWVPKGDKNFSWKAKPLTTKEAITAMENGYNIGIAATDTDALVIIDIDDPAVFADHDFASTLMSISGGRVGNHAFYTSTDPRTKINVALEKEGEIRSRYEYVVAPGSWAMITGRADKFGIIYQTVEERMEEIPEGDRDNAGKYELINSQPIEEITYDGLPKRFTQAYEQNIIDDEIKARESAERGDRSGNQDKSKSGIYSLKLSDVGSFPVGQSRFPSRLHDSSTGANSSISNNGELHSCWRDLVTHNALQYAAVLAGLYTCGEAGKAHSGSGAGSSRLDMRDGETVYSLWGWLKNERILPKDDPIPSIAAKWYALKNKLCTEDDIEGWKVPTNAYIEVLKAHGLYVEKTKCAPNRLTDWGNAKRLVAKHGGDIRYCPDMVCWNVWNEKIWEIDRMGHMDQKAKGVAVDLWAEAQRATDLQQKETIAKFAIASENQARIKNMIDSAQNEPGIPIDINDFDMKRDIICVGNGTLDLKTGQLSGFRKDDYISKQVGTDFIPGSKAPEFLKFLMRIIPDQDIRDFMQRLFGYCLTGQTREQVFCIFYGHGSNGKGTLLDTIMHILGVYAKTTEPDTIIQKKHERTSTNDIADLKGARLVVTSENEANQVIDEGRIKRITGQDKLKCRFLYKEFFEYVPEFKLILLTNHEPIIKAQDYSIWRRVVKVPFEVTIPKEEWDLQLRDKLIAESEGILAWMIEGAKEWYKVGLNVPESVKVATREYQEELDILGDFLNAYFEFGNDKEIRSSDIYTLYKHWCVISDQRGKSSNSFSREMTERNFKSTKKNGVRYKIGLDFKENLKKDFDLIKNIDNEKTLSRAIGSILDTVPESPIEKQKIISYANLGNTDPAPPTDSGSKLENRPGQRFPDSQRSSTTFSDDKTDIDAEHINSSSEECNNIEHTTPDDDKSDKLNHTVDKSQLDRLKPLRTAITMFERSNGPITEDNFKVFAANYISTTAHADYDQVMNDVCHICGISPQTDRVKVEILKDIPPIVGADLETYELSKGDIVDLPSLNATGLISKKLAKAVNQGVEA